MTGPRQNPIICRIATDVEELASNVRFLTVPKLRH